MRNRYFTKVLVLLLTLSVLMSGCLQTQQPTFSSDPTQSQNSATNSSNHLTDPSQTTNPSNEPTASTGGTVPDSTAPTSSANEPDTTVPATSGPTPTESATTAPATTAPATTAPATTKPATTAPATTAPATTAPATTAPATTKPATTAPATTKPATTAPATTKPATTAPATTKPAPTKPNLPDDEPQPALEMQGLKALKAHPQSANLTQAYDRIASGVASAAQDIDLQGLELTVDLLKMVYECYRNDYPEHFWLGSSYSYTMQTPEGDFICSLSPKYLFTGSELTSAKTKFDQAVNSILGKLSGSMSAYEKELAVHDALLKQCQYKQGSNAFNAYGALVEGVAVCEGYARSFQYLMHKTGISCMIVSGIGNKEAHAWNAVQIGSSWYYTDITWDDPVGGDGTLHYAYFNLTRAAMELDHTTEVEYIPLPNANATTYNYYVRNGTYLKEYNQSQLAQILQRENPARLYIAGDIDGFIQSFKSNINAILAEAGIRDCTGYGYSVCGKELIITLQRGT